MKKIDFKAVVPVFAACCLRKGCPHLHLHLSNHSFFKMLLFSVFEALHCSRCLMCLNVCKLGFCARFCTGIIVTHSTRCRHIFFAILSLNYQKVIYFNCFPYFFVFGCPLGVICFCFLFADWFSLLASTFFCLVFSPIDPL